MINICFRLQHPELYPELHGGKLVEVPVVFLRENAVKAELMPDWANAEGYVWPELGNPLAGVEISYEDPASPKEEPRFQDIVLLATGRLTDLLGESLYVCFKVAHACCSCREHVIAEVSRLDWGIKPLALIHCARDQAEPGASPGWLVITTSRGYRRKGKLSPYLRDAEKGAERLFRVLSALAR